MTETTIDRISLVRELEKELNYKRFVHTLGVAATAASLAMCYGENMEKAELAGLLHDCAKCMDLKKMVRLCESEGLEISEQERRSDALLHSKAGSILARTRYGVRDADILNAIRYHTTGRPGMSLLEKIIFIADYIEPGRNVAEDLPQVRALAFEDLDACLLLILKDTLAYLESRGAQTDPMTQRTWMYYNNRIAQ